MCHVLTDTDSTAIQFIIISDPNSDVPEPKFRDIIFEIVAAAKIYKRFDSSHEFWDNFDARKMSRKNKLGYFEIENIDNPCFVALAINPKKYFEVFKNQKGIRKGSRDTEFENFVGRIKSPVNFLQLNDKRFYFSDGIVSLPYGHQNF